MPQPTSQAGTSQTITTTPSVISSKALEKQLKIVESRMSILQAEITELEKIKNACLILMGVSSEPVSEAASETGKPKKKKAASEENMERENEPSEDYSEDAMVDSSAAH